MKLTVQAKLQPSPQQAAFLLQTLECANDAANFVSNWSWQHRTFHKYSVQKALYFRIKYHFSLPSQTILRVIAKVCDAYKVDRKRKDNFLQGCHCKPAILVETSVSFKGKSP